MSADRSTTNGEWQNIIEFFLPVQSESQQVQHLGLHLCKWRFIRSAAEYSWQLLNADTNGQYLCQPWKWAIHWLLSRRSKRHDFRFCSWLLWLGLHQVGYHYYRLKCHALDQRSSGKYHQNYWSFHQLTVFGKYSASKFTCRGHLYEISQKRQI